MISASERTRAVSRKSSSRSRATASYAQLKYESGVHRVQRVPATEAQGRIHTSTATVAVLPEAEEVDVKINPTTCASTSSARRARAGRTSTRPTRRCASRTCPTGMVVTCQDEKSAASRTATRRCACCARASTSRARSSQTRAGDARRAPVGTRRPQREDPHLQLPAEPRHRPPHQPRSQPGGGAGREPAAVHRCAGGRGTAAEAGGGGHPAALAQPGVITLAEVLRRSTGYLETHASPTPRLDADC